MPRRGAAGDGSTITPIGPRVRASQNFVDAFLHQIFVLGVFHGDPHPGNLFVTPDGRICFHDFGLVGSLDSDTRRCLAVYTNAFMRQDADWLLDAGIALGILGGAIDRLAFRRELAEIIADCAAVPLREWSLAEAFLRVARLGRAQNVFLPHHLVVLMGRCSRRRAWSERSTRNSRLCAACRSRGRTF